MSLAAAGAACVAYGTLIETRWFRLRHAVVPGVLRGPGELRVLHLTDTHLDPPSPPLVEFVASLAEHDVDLVVATGDLLGSADAEDHCAALLGQLTADGTPGLAVLGSNDLYGPQPKSPHWYFTDPDRRVHGVRLDTDRLVEGLEAGGYTVLRDARTAVEVDGFGRVAVGGLEDPHLADTVLPPLGQVAVADDDAAILRLGLVHAPYTAALDLLVDAGYELLLAGHTHGGQVRVPPFGALVDNCDLPLDQARGLSTWRGVPLHVSPGLGQSRYAPFRFCCRPEATILHLTG